MQGIVDLSSYTYELPDDRIARFARPDRASSKLLCYHEGNISHHQFSDIIDLLPANSSLFFNNTRVIPARLQFTKDTGALIEIFLLQPLEPSPVIAVAMEAVSPVVWKCMIGNAKRWKSGLLSRSLQLNSGEVRVTVEKAGQDMVKISWTSGLSFAQLVDTAGQTPLPPYLNREAVPADKSAYQTVYSAKDGAVAAPTAGLHFTGEILGRIRERGIRTSFLTLHVGAGTFQPIKTADVREHTMHSEQIIVTRENILSLKEAGRCRVAVGTTSMRTIESIYWYGLTLMRDPEAGFQVPKLFPYEHKEPLPGNDAVLDAILSRMDKLKTDELAGATEIFIFPGYKFRLVDGLITNFHQPGSTLILLVAAFAGDDWRRLYREALDNDYRFLSYGDSSFLIPRKQGEG